MRRRESGWPIPPAAPRTVTLEDCNSLCQHMPSQLNPLRYLISSKKLLNRLEAVNYTYLASRRGESAALSLSKSVPSSEHDECDGV